jgi:hypothetical protein
LTGTEIGGVSVNDENINHFRIRSAPDWFYLRVSTGLASGASCTLVSEGNVSFGNGNICKIKGALSRQSTVFTQIDINHSPSRIAWVSLDSYVVIGRKENFWRRPAKGVLRIILDNGRRLEIEVDGFGSDDPVVGRSQSAIAVALDGGAGANVEPSPATIGPSSIDKSELAE